MNLVAPAEKPLMSIVIVGHVDHGKSTVIGRLLADTGSLPKGKLEQIRIFCERNSRPFEYAFLLDALKDERAQNITIDTARIFFKSPSRRYLVLDAPGHIEFVKNMVTGAARAEAALLVIDAQEGVQENSRRHGHLLSLLGIQKIVVLINKMELVGYQQPRFEIVCAEYATFLETLGIAPKYYIPVSGREGDNIAAASTHMPWSEGPTLLEALDRFEPDVPPTHKPFRMSLQDIYRFTAFSDSRRIFVGSVISGRLNVGDTVIFYPSAKRSIVKSFETFNTPPLAEVISGQHFGMTLEEEIYIQRGEIATKASETPLHVSNHLRVSLFWLGKDPLEVGKELWLKIGTTKTKARVQKITRVINTGQTTHPTSEELSIGRNDVAECVFSLHKAVAFDLASELQETSRFVLVDQHEICGGGIILEDAGDTQRQVRDNVMIRNLKWEKSMIPSERRAEMYNQHASLVLVTGPRNTARKEVAKYLETMLFDLGKKAYYLAIGSVLHGIDADLSQSDKQLTRQEHIRRTAEVAHILLDAGLILIVTAIELDSQDLDVFKTIVDPDEISVVWVGDDVNTNIPFDLKLSEYEDVEMSAMRIKQLLYERSIIFRP